MKLQGGNLIAHHFFRGRNAALNEIYAVMAFRSFICSFIGIFVPIYLWNLKFPLAEIFLFYVISYGVTGLLELPVAYLHTKTSSKNLIGFSLIALVTHFLLLWTIPVYHWPLWFVAPIASLAIAFFWQAYHWDFSRAKHNDSASKEIGMTVIVTSLFGALGPLLGGIIAGYMGIGYVFGLVVISLFFAVIPLLFSKETSSPKQLDFKKINLNGIKYQAISYSGKSFHGIVGEVVWPIFIFLVIKTYQNVGLVTSLALILTLIFTYIISKAADHGKRQKYLKTGSIMLSLIWFVKVLASTFLHVFSLDFLSNIANSFFYPSFISEYYLHADEEKRAEYFCIMEMIGDFSRALVPFTLFLLTFVLNDKTVLIIGLVFAGFGSFLIGLMPPARSEIQINNKNIKIMPRPAKAS